MSAAGLRLDGDSYTIDYATEFDLRDGLAELAVLTGWDVETEHVVAGWGRPDLYLGAQRLRVAVEIKLDLSTPSKCRKGIQQAASYRRALPELSEVILTAPHINRAAMSEYAGSYPEVWVMDANELCRWLRGAASVMRERHSLALARFREAERTFEVHRRVLADLACYPDSPVSALVPHEEQVCSVAGVL